MGTITVTSSYLCLATPCRHLLVHEYVFDENLDTEHIVVAKVASGIGV